jgi:carbonic anhydrase
MRLNRKRKIKSIDFDKQFKGASGTLREEHMPLKLLVGIRHFKNHQLKEKRELLASLSKGQSPDVVFITCSDSRIDPHLFTHSGLGTLFVGRNPGNIIAPIDASSSASGEGATIEFGLMHLKVSEIIICGHSHCGAMKGLLTYDLDKQLPNTAAWLRHSSVLVENLELRHPEITPLDALLKLKCLTQDNILLQMEYLKTHPAVKLRLAEGNLKIHGWYYEIETGEVYIYNQQKKAFVPFEQTVEELALEKLKRIVAEETLNYFTRLLKPNSIEEFFSLVNIYNKVRFIGVSPIWEHIEAKVRYQLHQQVGELYITEVGGINSLFDELLKKGPAIRLQNLGGIYKTIEKSPFYATLYTPRRTQHLIEEASASSVQEQTILRSNL